MVSKLRWKIRGTSVKMVRVKVDTGYACDPGYSCNGTIIYFIQ